MKAEKLEEVLECLDDIMSSGQGDELTDWHKSEVEEMFKEHELTANELKKVVKAYYSGDTFGMSIDELKWMMGICGVSSFTIKI